MVIIDFLSVLNARRSRKSEWITERLIETNDAIARVVKRASACFVAAAPCIHGIHAKKAAARSRQFFTSE
jgi:hypothetical protein